MIARVSFLLPFIFQRSVGAKYEPHKLNLRGCDVTVGVPVQSTARSRGVSPAGITMDNVLAMLAPANPERLSVDVLLDGRPIIEADLLQVCFHRADFERRPEAIQAANAFDPPQQLSLTIANDFLRRIRARTGDFHVRPLDEDTLAVVEYLDDALQPLPKEEGKLRGTGLYHRRISLNPITVEVWQDVAHAQDDVERLQVWDTLLLDASKLLPDVGPAIVLAATALETLAAQLLDRLAAQSTIPDVLWEWITDRGEHLKNPSPVEQFDVLLKLLMGRSLKEDIHLWQRFHDLRRARNTFAHRGEARLGGQAVSLMQARELLADAERIVSWIEAAAPPDLRRPRVTTKIQVAVRKETTKTAIQLAQTATVYASSGARILKEGVDDKSPTK